MTICDFEIRPAVTADFGQLCDLFRELDDLHRQARPDLFRKLDGPPREFADVESLIAGPESTILLAEDRMLRQVIGFETLILRDIVAHGVRRTRRIVEIDNLGVRNDARRRGVGRALVQEAFGWSADLGCAGVELTVYAFNAAAVSFYEKIGFATVTRRLGAPVAK
ncbi:GNAT family N-acetyltransferase [Telmatospirillum sp.]|uniref:GNAT family N-acetyltransferase n=1 Tax=Telmatospirillum sp. TaxID=2079197 RepID=UPI002851D305|nr:GNAT family N-acetyltransferase [Telmatospirillum sp.]MDR3435035.1 GNAT family N-acetyltransferase [Telmatospirillum sp.]